MAEAFLTWRSVILATVASVPSGVLVVFALARFRIGAGAPSSQAWRSAIAEVGMVVGTAPWVWMILTPRSGSGGLELIPGRGLATIIGGEPAVAIVQVGGNLLVFAAFGFFAPVRWRLGIAAVAAYAATGSVIVETLQHTLQLGRVSSVDDVALNALGAALAALCSYRWSRRRTDAHPSRGEVMAVRDRDWAR
jgi:hypothetical protein